MMKKREEEGRRERRERREQRIEIGGWIFNRKGRNDGEESFSKLCGLFVCVCLVIDLQKRKERPRRTKQ